MLETVYCHNGPSSAKSETRFTFEIALIMFWSHKMLCLSCIQFGFGNYAILYSYISYPIYSLNILCAVFLSIDTSIAYFDHFLGFYSFISLLIISPFPHLLTLYKFANESIHDWVWDIILLLCIQFPQRVFSIDSIVKPLPPAMTYNVSCNLNFFTRIFSQFFGKFQFLCAFYG